MRQRDIYNDYMTRYEMTALLRAGGNLDAEIQRRSDNLASRSGVVNVTSGVVIRRSGLGREELRLRAVFNSSAWTGRDYRKHLRKDVLSRAFWWLWVGVRKSLCRHETIGFRDVCAKCGLTAESIFDHSWRNFPRGVYR